MSLPFVSSNFFAEVARMLEELRVSRREVLDRKHRSWDGQTPPSYPSRVCNTAPTRRCARGGLATLETMAPRVSSCHAFAIGQGPKVSRSNNKESGRSVLPALLVGVGCWYAFDYTGPTVIGQTINPLSALALLGLLASAMAVLAAISRLLFRYVEWVRVRTPTGLKGTAGWITSLREIEHELIHKGWGFFWGSFKGEPVFSGFESSAYVVAPSASGKTTKLIIPNALALKDFDKFIVDFRSDLAPQLKRALEAEGNDVVIINLGDLYTDLVGEGSEYNPVCLIADCFWQPGGLLDVSDVSHELSLQLYPDPKESKGRHVNSHFDDGSRDLLEFVEQAEVLINGYDATLGGILQLLNDRENLLRHALWAAGRLEVVADDEYESKAGQTELAAMPIEDSPWVDRHDPEEVANYIAYFRGLAAKTADLLNTTDSRTMDSFLTGAQQSLARFNVTTRAHKKMRGSSFRFSQLKEGDRPTTVICMLDPEKINAQAPALGMIQWGMSQEIKRHPNKRRPVFVLADEVTNIPWSGLASLITWSRAYGLRPFFSFQNFPAFRIAHGENALKVLQSETEIKLFLPGQREPETLKLIESMLSEESVVVQSHRGSKDGGAFNLDGYDFREEGHPLMTADEIRRSKKSILFLRDNKPLLLDNPSVAAISPWRRQIDVNPFFGKPYLQRVVLRLGHRNGNMLTRLYRLIRRKFRSGGKS